MPTTAATASDAVVHATAGASCAVAGRGKILLAQRHILNADEAGRATVGRQVLRHHGIDWKLGCRRGGGEGGRRIGLLLLLWLLLIRGGRSCQHLSIGRGIPAVYMVRRRRRQRRRLVRLLDHHETRRRLHRRPIEATPIRAVRRRRVRRLVLQRMKLLVGLLVLLLGLVKRTRVLLRRLADRMKSTVATTTATAVIVLLQLQRRHRHGR